MPVPRARPAAPPPAAGAAVRRVEVADFRSHAAFALDLEARPVALTGPNGVGKTNLLEAVSMLAPGRGLRRARFAAMARDGTAGWTVAAEVETGGRSVRLGTGWTADGGRRVRIDGGEAASGRLAEILSVQWLSPSMDGIFNDTPSARRRFLDRLVAGTDPGHLARATAWERAARERRGILERDGADSWLRPVERAMGEAAVRLAASRLEGAARLGAALAERTGPFPAAELEVRGAVESLLGGLGPDGAAERLADSFARERDGDLRSGRTASGPHRSDLFVRHRARGEDAARCSSGEQKALLVSIALAAARVESARRGAPPLVLLDEACAHLDARRRDALAGELGALGVQAWLTGTDEDLFRAFRDAQPVRMRPVRVASRREESR